MREKPGRMGEGEEPGHVREVPGRVRQKPRQMGGGPGIGGLRAGGKRRPRPGCATRVASRRR
ncbi:hypothetical protein AB0K12_43670 [Nonomuraea sp. NPDC049419]|uniref:hypothetical protein n=1 Tax=Nonomuraea sp. NPDC049419 TaxID=3155772 RepID=UPI00341CBB14